MGEAAGACCCCPVSGRVGTGPAAGPAAAGPADDWLPLDIILQWSSSADQPVPPLISSPESGSALRDRDSSYKWKYGCSVTSNGRRWSVGVRETAEWGFRRENDEDRVAGDDRRNERREREDGVLMTQPPASPILLFPPLQRCPVPHCSSLPAPPLAATSNLITVPSCADQMFPHPVTVKLGFGSGWTAESDTSGWREDEALIATASPRPPL